MKTKRKVKCPICGLPCIQVRKYTDGSIATFHEMKYTKGFKSVMPEVTKICYREEK